MEQKANIKFCFKMGEITTETFKPIKRAYGDNAASCIWVFEWYVRFRDGCVSLEGEHSGQPAAIRTPGMIITIWELISTDHLNDFSDDGREYSSQNLSGRSQKTEDLH
jgi:hypothetical protein